MSVIVRYSDNTTYTLNALSVNVQNAQGLEQYHIPYTHRNLALRLGLSFQNITVSGSVESKTACKWHDIIAISLDGGTSYQTVYFTDGGITDDQWSAIYPFELTLTASPLKEYATATRFPTTGYQWGDSSVSSVKQLGNTLAYPIIYYLSPLMYFPLLENLEDFAGEGLTFTRALAKVHAGVSYGVNTPIYDNGLFISSETSQDVPLWTPAASTLKTIAMQIKQTAYPKAWVIGAGAGTANLLTANQSNAETDTTGVSAIGATLTRNTSTPIAGTGDFKLVATESPCLLFEPTPYITITPSKWYCGQATVRTTGTAAGRTVHAQLTWYTAADAEISSTDGVAVSAPTTATVISVIGVAPATAYKVSLRIWLDSAVASEVMYVDSLMLELIPDLLTVWTAALNKLTIDTLSNLLKWTDDTTTVQVTFPTASYMAGALTDLVVVENTSHAVTVAVHAAGGAWASQTGTLAAIAYPELTLGNLEGSISHLIEYPYALVAAEWEALDFSLAPLRYNNLFVGNKYAETITKGSDGALVTASGADITGLLAGEDIAIGSTDVTITQLTGLSARWYVEVKRTDI